MASLPLTHRNTGLKFSGILHLILLVLAIVGLPKWFRRTEDLTPQVMTVDILPFAPTSNVRPSPEKTPDKPVEKPQKAETRKAIPETHKTEAHPQEAVPAPSPLAKPVKPADKPKPQKADEDLKKILQSVKETVKTEESKKPKEAKAAATTPAKSETFDPSAPLSISEKDAIRSQFVKCWNVPAGARDAQNLVVTLRVGLSADGGVTDVKLAHDEERYGSDSFFRAAADSAMRAVHLCSPLKNLPPDKFGAWHDMELTFDPKEML